MKKRILKRVAKVFEVKEEDIITPSRKRRLTDARLAYFLCMDRLGIDIHRVNKSLIFSHTMPSYYVARAIELFKRSMPFREEIKKIMAHFDKSVYEQFERQNPFALEKYKFKKIIRKEPNDMYFSKVKSVAIKANYTEHDNVRIDRACRDAISFFESYGKGLKHLPIVDRKHYE